MGSPISVLVAEAILPRLESLVFQHHGPKVWAQYVDDTFVVIERDHALTFKEHLNAVLLDIHLTMEEKENNQLVFLDVRDGLWWPKNQSVQEGNRYDANTELQQQPPDQSQTQLRKDSIPAC
ncbi:hypothetical protein SprV_0501983100 [Sparganum proliferum]